MTRNEVIRNRDVRRTVGAKGINCRVYELIFDREVKNQSRDSDTIVFDWMLRGDWTHSYAVMIGNGNGLEPASSLQEGLDHYIYWSSEKELSKVQGPLAPGWKIYVWTHLGQRNFILTDSSITIGTDLPEVIKRTRKGIGTVYRSKPWRFSAEYITGKGMIFQGPEKPGFNIGPYECINGKAKGYYLDIGYYIPASRWNLDLRYDNYLRCEGHPQIEASFDNVTLGAQYHFGPQSKLMLNYEIRSGEATGNAPLSSFATGLTVIGNRLGLQLTTIF